MQTNDKACVRVVWREPAIRDLIVYCE
jgi:hypothetical protein